MTRSALARTDRYSQVAILFHWLLALLIIGNLIGGFFHDALGAKVVMPIHKATGITILALTVLRIGWRLIHRAPPLPAEVRGWERTAAHLSHFLLYALMILVPLTGWMMSSGGNPPRPLNWFGLFPIPYLPVDKAAAGLGAEAHEVLGFAMAGLVILHIAAALRHHLILRDGVFQRMLPSA